MLVGAPIGPEPGDVGPSLAEFRFAVCGTVGRSCVPAVAEGVEDAGSIARAAARGGSIGGGASGDSAMLRATADAGRVSVAELAASGRSPGREGVSGTIAGVVGVIEVLVVTAGSVDSRARWTGDGDGEDGSGDGWLDWGDSGRVSARASGDGSTEARGSLCGDSAGGAVTVSAAAIRS